METTLVCSYSQEPTMHFIFSRIVMLLGNIIVVGSVFTSFILGVDSVSLSAACSVPKLNTKFCI